MKKKRLAVFFSSDLRNTTLTYQSGWPRAIAQSPLFDCFLINLSDQNILEEVGLALKLSPKKFDALVFLHSVFSNQQNLKHFLFLIISTLRVPKVYFIGNEYKLMPEKIKFCRRLGIDLLISQCNDEKILAAYRKNLKCAVDSIPNTGFDPSIFRSKRKLSERKLDIGYRAFEAPFYIGNNEKTAIAELFNRNKSKYNITTDISLDPQERFNEQEYSTFLNHCRGQIGTEAGGDYFDLTDTIRTKVNAHILNNPETTFFEIKRLFFDNLPQMPKMRIISGRQVEAAACKTVQILYFGRYNDYFKPNVHYIPLEKDGSNLDEVIEKFRDDSYCEEIAKNAYNVAMESFRYEKLTEKFARILDGIL